MGKRKGGNDLNKAALLVLLISLLNPGAVVTVEDDVVIVERDVEVTTFEVSP